jgi:3',5'-cyclic AMP phosphodiesterase CpdA
MRRRGPLALIGVNTGVPTLPFFATGTVGKNQRADLADMLDQTREEGLFRVVMIHHPPLRSSARFGRGLSDAEAVTKILADHGAELVLHGHNHRHAIARTAGKHGEIPILGVASSSAVPGTPHHRAEYHLIRINTSTLAIEIERRGCKDAGSQPECLEKTTIRHELLTP